MTGDSAGAPQQEREQAEEMRLTEAHFVRLAHIRLHDYPALKAFFDKHAVGSKLRPSCLVCGRDDYAKVGVSHAELPDIVVCERCRDAAHPRSTSVPPEERQKLLAEQIADAVALKLYGGQFSEARRDIARAVAVDALASHMRSAGTRSETTPPEENVPEVEHIMQLVREALWEARGKAPDDMPGFKFYHDNTRFVAVREAVERLASESSRNARIPKDDPDLSVICRQCDTLVGGVEAGSKVRWVYCQDCAWRNARIVEALREELKSFDEGCAEQLQCENHGTQIRLLRRILSSGGGPAPSEEQRDDLNMADVMDELERQRSGLREEQRLPVERREPWVASEVPSDGTPPWGIGIRNKGAREWFDTKEDAQRAVALLNRATMPSVMEAPKALPDEELLARAMCKADGYGSNLDDVAERRADEYRYRAKHIRDALRRLSTDHSSLGSSFGARDEKEGT